MNLDKAKLQAALKKAMPGVDQGSSLIPGADTFLFTEGFVHTYNDLVSVSAPCEVKGVDGAVKCEDLYRPISKMPTPVVELTLVEDKLQIVAGRVKQSIRVVTSELTEYVKKLAIDAINWKDLPEGFMDALKLTRIPANTTNYRGVVVQGDAMLATDTIQINHYKFKQEMDSFWIDESAVSDLLRIGMVPKQYGVSDEWYHAKFEDGTVFSARRKPQGEYPFDIMLGVLEKHARLENSPANVFPSDISEVADRVATMAADLKGTLPVCIKLMQKELEVSASRDTGDITELIPWEKEFEVDPGVTVWINSDFLMEAGNHKAMNFYISYDEDKTPWVVFTSPEFTQVAGSMSSPE